MAKKYTGTLSLDWYNKQKSILIQKEEGKSKNDIPAPKINWVNREESIFYEIDEKEGKGLEPFWVDKNDIRVKEARPLVFKKAFLTEEKKDKKGELSYTLKESNKDDPEIQNILIKGDNLLALNSMAKHFSTKSDSEKVKCIYIDPPFNTDSSFQHYEDSMEHSLWLSMMKDRLLILKNILSETGTLFIHLDDNEIGYLLTLLDEIFGRSNRAPIITFKQASATGHKAINPGVVSTCNYILMYSKNKQFWNPKKIFTARERNERYNNFVKNRNQEISNWEIITLASAFAQFKNVPVKKARKLISNYDQELNNFVLKNAESVIQLAYPDYDSVGSETRDLIDLSKEEPMKIVLQTRQDHPDIFLLNGQRLLFYSDRLKMIDGKYVAAEPLTNLWDDILSNNLHKEGGISFPKGKKPEALVKRCIEMTSEEGDIVLDCFLGSGTTAAVSHKLNRRWIGIEVGKNAETHIIPRMSSVLNGEDQSGISKTIEWKGGGSFKYYHLGPSIITTKNNEKDFNWKLGKKIIEESLLSTYDYIQDDEIDFSQINALKTKETRPSIGFQKIGNKTRVAIISLQSPEEKSKGLSIEEVSALYEILKTKYSPEYVNIFTNRGVDLAYDSKPDDLEIIKVPNAIFAELER
jgi:adenine-specific DNA-methyltransferase